VSLSRTSIPVNETATFYVTASYDPIASYSDIITVTYDNGLTATASVGMTVIKNPNGASVSAPTENSKTTTSITVNAVTASTNQSVEYARSTSSDGTGLSAWQSDTTFTGLTPYTTYYVYARSVDNGLYATGPTSSASAGIRTIGLGSLSITSSMNFGTVTYNPTEIYGYKTLTLNNGGNGPATLQSSYMTIEGTDYDAFLFTPPTAPITIESGNNYPSNTSIYPRGGGLLNARTYSATLKVTYFNGRETATTTATISLIINRATLTPPAPESSSINTNSITIKTISAPASGQTVQYGRVAANGPISSVTWQTAAAGATTVTFSSLGTGTTHDFYIRYTPQNTNYNEAVSAKTTLSTIYVGFIPKGEEDGLWPRAVLAQANAWLNGKYLAWRREEGT
jgi:hypothetical protein